jgi:hypothetical protein
MEVSNTSSFVGATWIPYVTLMPWMLTSAAGQETVYVQFKSVSGFVVGSAQASIDFVPGGALASSSSVAATSSISSLSLSPAAQLAALQADLAALLAGSGITISQPSITSPAFLFTHNLSFGVTGTDVKALQLFLISRNAGPAAAMLAAHGATKNFASLTFAALVEFQKSVDITPASGFFGPKTRAYVNANN